MIKIYASGRLTNDAKVFTYGSNGSGVSFTVASNDRGSDDTDFIQCTMFNRDENFAQYLKKGQYVVASGRYKRNEQGYVSCIVDDFEFGGFNKNN